MLKRPDIHRRGQVAIDVSLINIVFAGHRNIGGTMRA